LYNVIRTPKLYFESSKVIRMKNNVQIKKLTTYAYAMFVAYFLICLEVFTTHILTGYSIFLRK